MFAPSVLLGAFLLVVPLGENVSRRMTKGGYMFDKERKPINNNPSLKSYARELRKNMTKEEKQLWFGFLAELPVRFRRQAIIDNYIVDFLCVKERMVIELDGLQHFDNDKQIKKDKKRDEFLKKAGFTVLRYSNYEINSNFRGVCEDIYSRLNIKT